MKSNNTNIELTIEQAEDIFCERLAQILVDQVLTKIEHPDKKE